MQFTSLPLTSECTVSLRAQIPGRSPAAAALWPLRSGRKTKLGSSSQRQLQVHIIPSFTFTTTLRIFQRPATLPLAQTTSKHKNLLSNASSGTTSPSQYPSVSKSMQPTTSYKWRKPFVVCTRST